ncbi:hypothetical protein EUGRSUZ_B00750, partial [Eucalyptus grandis]
FHGVHSNFSTICDPVLSSFPCGNVFIQYPFWIESDAPVHCGFPGLGLDCPYGSPHPILLLPDDAYFVTDINYTEATLTLVDIPVARQECPRTHRNLTIDSLPLGYNSIVNLTFFFNCSAPLGSPLPAEGANDCLRSGDNQSCVFVDMSPEEAADFDKERSCEEEEVAVVKRTEVTAAEEYAGAIREWFVLDWKVAKECGKCEHSGGRCAFNQTGDLLCFCKDGSNHTDGSVCK